MTYRDADRLVRGFMAIVLVTGLSGCAWIGLGSKDVSLDDYGMYAVHDGDRQRLDGDREWEMKTWEVRSNLAPGTEFLIRHPRLQGSHATHAEMVQLRRVAWIRSEITDDGEIVPVEGSTWAVTEMDALKLPIRVEPVTSDPQAVRVVPAQRLEPGLYSLQLRSESDTISARLGVDWSSTDRRRYSAANCVDRYLGDKTTYRPCSEQEQALASKWLRIHLVEPEVRNVQGSNKLVVQGVVINTSDRPRKVPTLEAYLRSAEGRLLKTWRFDPSTAEVDAGASSRFRGEVPDPPPGTKTIHVTFAPGSAR